MQESESQIESGSDAIKVRDKVRKDLAQYREQFESDWKKYDDAYYGKQHKTGEGDKPVKNMIFATLEREVPVLTDSMAGTNLTASKKEKQEAADMLCKGIKYVYNDQDLILKLPTLCRAGLTSAPGLLWVSYEPDEEFGEGKIVYTQIPWKSVFLDGNAQTLEESEGFHLELNRRKGTILRKWPEKEKEIKDVTTDSSSSKGSDNNYEKRDVEKNSEMGKPQDYKADDIVKYQETWVKTYDLEEVPAEEVEEDLKKEYQQLSNGEAPNIKKWEPHDEHEARHLAQKIEILSQFGINEDAPFEELEAMVAPLLEQNPQMGKIAQDALLKIKVIENHREQHRDMKKLNPEGKRPKYKDGWRVIKSVGRVVLYDGPNPLQDNLIPLVPFYGYKDQTIYGFGEVKNIFSPQVTLNDMDNYEIMGLRRVTNGGWVKDAEADIAEGALTNEPGLVITKPRGTDVRRLEPGTVSPQLEQRKRADQQDMATISGMDEATMNGEMPSGQASGVTVTKIQNQAIGRIRLKDRNLQHYSMKRLAMITASFIKKFWTDERTLRFRGDGFDIQEFYFNPVELEDLKYSVEISPGSMAGIDKDALNAFYVGLLNGGHITLPEALAVIEIPKKEVILKALEKRDAQAQQTQQMQEQIATAQAQYEQEIAKLQQENIKLKGALDLGKEANTELLNPSEKKIFKQQEKQASINNLVMDQIIPELDNGAIPANQNNQGIL